MLCSTIFCGQNTAKKINLWATYYYIPTLQHSPTGLDLLDKQEKETGLKLSACDWCTAAIEGTVYIKKEDSTYILNYAGRSQNMQNNCRQCSIYKNYAGYNKTGKVLWQVSQGFGKGVKNYNLGPYVTIAVDNAVIPVGSVVYIPQAKGVIYLNATGQMVTHDGYFFAGDVGSKITGNHIDVFLGTATKNPFSFIKSAPPGIFEAYIISDKTVLQNLENQHK